MVKIIKKILVIDDNIDILEAIKIILEEEGYEVIALDTGDNIFNAIDKNNLPDLVLLDLLLSGKDGITVIHELHAKEETKNIPIILNSAHPKVKDIWINSGASAFIAKPFDMKDLLALINSFNIVL